MNVDLAEQLAYSLLEKHGLSGRPSSDWISTSTGWRVIWESSWLVRAGRTNRILRWIHLSQPIVELNDEAAVRNLILHEIAHALTSGGHDIDWQMMCRKIGCSSDINPAMILPRRPSRKKMRGRRAWLWEGGGKKKEAKA
jgi:hypothetical protein